MTSLLPTETHFSVVWSVIGLSVKIMRTA